MAKRAVVMAVVAGMLAGCGTPAMVAATAPAGVRQQDVSKAKAEEAAGFLIDRYGSYSTSKEQKLQLAVAIGRTGQPKGATSRRKAFGGKGADEVLKLAIVKGLAASRSDAAVDFLMERYGSYSTSEKLKVAIVEALGVLAGNGPTTALSWGTSRKDRITSWLKKVLKAAGSPKDAILDVLGRLQH